MWSDTHGLSANLPSCFPLAVGSCSPSLRGCHGDVPEAARRLGLMCLLVRRQCRGGGEQRVISWQMKLGLEGAVATELAGPPICLALAQRAKEEEDAVCLPHPILCH